MKIYTKTGDKGKTSLFDGTRVYKNNIRVEAYGTIDELNSVIGIVISQKLKIKSQKYKSKVKSTLIMIQNDLFEVGACLANPNTNMQKNLQEQLEEHTLTIEKYIDELTEQMPELKHFILPGGGMVGAFLQLARTVSRRAERNIVALSQQETVGKEVLMYINRLSDLFHTMSRYVNYQEGKKETIWEHKVQRRQTSNKSQTLFLLALLVPLSLLAHMAH